MYCKKLINILEHDENKKYRLKKKDLAEISDFIRRRPKKERNKLDPVRTAMKLNMSLSKVLGFYIIGSYIELFKINLIYKCKCGEKIKLKSIKKAVVCPECGSTSIPNEYNDTTYIHFLLLETPNQCKQFDHHFENQLDEVDMDKIAGDKMTLKNFSNTMEGGESEARKYIENMLGGE